MGEQRTPERRAGERLTDAAAAVLRGHIAAAVAAEREACAKVAEGYDDSKGEGPSTARNIAEDIRKRGDA